MPVIGSLKSTYVQVSFLYVLGNEHLPEPSSYVPPPPPPKKLRCTSKAVLPSAFVSMLALLF